jgi:hypothetical protein
MALQDSRPTLDHVQPEESPGILTDEQIEQLLQEAENQFKKASTIDNQKIPTPEDDGSLMLEKPGKRKPCVLLSPFHFRHLHSERLPKLSHGLKIASYLEEKNGIARADEKRMLSDEQRKLSNTLRAAEVNQVLEETRKKVRSIPNVS